MKWKCFLIYFKKAPPAGVEPQFPGRGSSVLPLRHSASFYLWLENRAIYISRPILVSHLTNLTTHLKAPIFVMSWWLLTKKMNVNVNKNLLWGKVVMSIPGPLIRDGGNTNPSYQLQPLVSTDLTRGFLSWLGATREISWYSGLELILGVRILPPSLMGSRYRYNKLKKGRQVLKWATFFAPPSQTVDNLRGLLRSAGDRVKPIFGICLGHQLLGVAAGGKTYKLKWV